MMWYVTGDTHRVFQRIYDKFPNREENKNIAVIILGDAGINYEGAVVDSYVKKKLQATNLTFYCVRGNHEMRPEDVDGMNVYEDELVSGSVWREPNYPNIRYFVDGCIYNINGKSFLTIGGAYSVDKYYRIMMNRKWFAREQLTKEEMEEINFRCNNQHFDYILSHTCPYSWQPTDLFLKGLDQNTVDNTMERWLDKFKDTITFDYYLFGHYHTDRTISENPYVRIYYQNIEELKL